MDVSIEVVRRCMQELDATRRQLAALLAFEQPLRSALDMPAVDENTMDMLVEVAIDRLNQLQRVAEAGDKLAVNLRYHADNDLFDFEFNDNIDAILADYERLRGRR